MKLRFAERRSWYKICMWLFTRYGFFSVACARKQGGKSYETDPDTLMIRARKARHLENLKQRFSALVPYAVRADAGTDYRYRIIVPKEVWVGVVAELASEQTWPNFKDEAARFLGPDDNGYSHALHRVWNVMYALQGAGRDA